MKEIKVKNTVETLNTVSNIFQFNKRAIFSRFGDGDIFIMMGKDINNQAYDENLAKELKASFKINDPCYLVALNINTPKEKGMMSGLFKPFPTNSILENYVVANFKIKEVYENTIFLHYLAAFKPALIINFFYENIIREKKMFVGNIDQFKVEKLLGNIDKYIKVPEKNAYETINEWWPQIEKNLEYVDLVIVATGISGRAVNKRIWDSNVEVKSFDIGSIVDITSNKITRKWIELAGHRINRYLLNKKMSLVSYYMKELKLRLRYLLER